MSLHADVSLADRKEGSVWVSEGVGEGSAALPLHHRVSGNFSLGNGKVVPGVESLLACALELMRVWAWAQRMSAGVMLGCLLPLLFCWDLLLNQCQTPNLSRGGEI